MLIYYCSGIYELIDKVDQSQNWYGVHLESKQNLNPVLGLDLPSQLIIYMNEINVFSLHYLDK